jgi:hypothetical protein
VLGSYNGEIMRLALGRPNRISMFDWIATTFWMVFGRTGPRDVPSSQSALAQGALIYAVVSSLDAALVFRRPEATLFGVADLAYTALVVALGLRLRRRWHRLPQTLLAILGVGGWLTLPSILVNSWVVLTRTSDTPASVPIVLQCLLAAVLVLSIWSLGRILRDALDVDLYTGITVSMTYVLLEYGLLIAIPARLFT